MRVFSVSGGGGADCDFDGGAERAGARLRAGQLRRPARSDAGYLHEGRRADSSAVVPELPQARIERADVV